jgi:hypothetical protein
MAAVVGALLAGGAAAAGAQQPDGELPSYLRDRGTGVANSQFGTYTRPGQLRIYPYFEYYLDDNYEYKPAELGYGLDQDFRGRYRAAEWLVFVAYGISDRVVLEIEAAVITATLDKSSLDTSATPARLKRSGLGDVESQLRMRWMTETERRPELFSYFEVVFPFQEQYSLIGTTDWEGLIGVGVTRGMRWGTVTARLTAEYDGAEGSVALGEYAAEYLKRLSPAWRLYGAVEGSEDEVELITEAQWHVTRNVFVKFNNAFGLTSKAPDWAPEIGVMIALRVPNN